MLTDNQKTQLKFWATASADNVYVTRPTDRALSATALIVSTASQLGRVPGFAASPDGGMELETVAPGPVNDQSIVIWMNVLCDDPRTNWDAQPTETDAPFWISAYHETEEVPDVVFDNITAAVAVTHLMEQDPAALYATLREVTQNAPAGSTTVSLQTASDLVSPAVSAALDDDALHTAFQQIAATYPLNQITHNDTDRLAMADRYLQLGSNCVHVHTQ